MIIKVVAAALLTIIVGRVLAETFIKERKSYPESYYLGVDSDRKVSVREMQQILSDQGLYEGQIDGVLGRDTRRALKALQKKKRLKPDGKVDARTAELLKELKANQPQLTTGHEAEGARLIDSAIYPAPELVWDMGLMAGVMNVQSALKKGGYYVGQVDGKNGPLTKKAIKSFQRAQGLRSDGVVGRRTAELLKKLLLEEGTP